MPELDGISGAAATAAKKRDLIITWPRRLTRRNAEISFKALSLGASTTFEAGKHARAARP